MRIGAMIIKPDGPAHVLVYDPPPDIVRSWGNGASIINQAELYAAPVVVSTCPDLLRGESVIWFIDNSAAEAALVKAGSPTETMCRLALVATAALASIKARPWYEHVPSKDNPADVLSRDGLQDPGIAAAVEAGRYVVRTPEEPPAESVLDYDYWWSKVADAGVSVGAPTAVRRPESAAAQPSEDGSQAPAADSAPAKGPCRPLGAAHGAVEPSRRGGPRSTPERISD